LRAPWIAAAGVAAALAAAGAGRSASRAASDAVRVWTPAGISSELFESHPAFDPITGDFYFVRSAKDFSGWRLLMSHCGPQGWTPPSPPPFAAPGLEADPVFTADGRSLYYISSRATGVMASRALDIWRVDRDAGGAWAAPVRLPAPVNSDQAEWFPRPGPDGWLYFGSSRPGGAGRTDIWRVRQGQGTNWTVQNLGPSINTAADEYEPLPSPDGGRLIIATGDGLYESRRTGTTWAPRTRLGPALNVNGSEIGPLFSPSGRSLLFARDLGGDRSGELVLWRIDGHEDWPKDCRPRAAPKP
jgi:Tol biopolymer transport system component